MGKMVEIRLHSLTCEFAGDDGDDLEVAGSLIVQSFDNPISIKDTQSLFESNSTEVQLRKGQRFDINHEVRVAMPTLGDETGFGHKFIRFGGNLIEKDSAPDTDDPLGEQWQVLGTNDIINRQPRMWHLYFGRNEQVVRADISVVVAHDL